MGRDKATLPFRGGRLIDHVAGRLAEAIESQDAGARAEILVSGAVAGFRCVSDRAPGLGPLGGVASVLGALPPAPRRDHGPEGLLIVPVDMPSLAAESMSALIRFWTSTCGAWDGAAFAGRELPLLLSLSGRVRNAVEALCGESVAPGLRSIRELQCRLRVLPLDTKSCAEREFLNANTPDDWLRAQP